MSAGVAPASERVVEMVEITLAVWEATSGGRVLVL